ncbi:hypothetical protein [Streptomyces sp. NPDC058603]|uniref:hypothetical protein n=1 Tax=Streptomyces sp. NPDC058603 TaxID=3346551 RepID=UPI0036574AD8
MVQGATGRRWPSWKIAIGVERLAEPGVLVEIEAVAVRRVTASAGGCPCAPR